MSRIDFDEIVPIFGRHAYTLAFIVDQLGFVWQAYELGRMACEQ